MQGFPSLAAAIVSLRKEFNPLRSGPYINDRYFGLNDSSSGGISSGSSRSSDSTSSDCYLIVVVFKCRNTLVMMNICNIGSSGDRQNSEKYET